MTIQWAPPSNNYITYTTTPTTTTSLNDYIWNTRMMPKPKRIMPPYKYLIAHVHDGTDVDKVKVTWRKHPTDAGMLEVFVGRMMLGQVGKWHEGGWSAQPRNGTMIDGFANRRLASAYILSYSGYEYSLEEA